VPYGQVLLTSLILDQMRKGINAFFLTTSRPSAILSRGYGKRWRDDRGRSAVGYARAGWGNADHLSVQTLGKDFMVLLPGLSRSSRTSAGFIPAIIRQHRVVAR
jgi:hypothetical protein